MCMSSMPLRMIRAQRKSLKPCIGRVMRLTARWCCSTMLLRNLHCRITTLVPCFLFVVLDSGVVRAALVEVDDLGKAVVLDGAREEAPRRTTIAFGGQQEVDGVALFIHGTIPVTIFPADLDIGFVQAPTLADRTEASFALPFTKGFLQHRDQLDGPAVNRGMIDEQAGFCRVKR